MKFEIFKKSLIKAIEDLEPQQLISGLNSSLLIEIGVTGRDLGVEQNSLFLKDGEVFFCEQEPFPVQFNFTKEELFIETLDNHFEDIIGNEWLSSNDYSVLNFNDFMNLKDDNDMDQWLESNEACFLEHREFTPFNQFREDVLSSLSSEMTDSGFREEFKEYLNKLEKEESCK